MKSPLGDEREVGMMRGTVSLLLTTLIAVEPVSVSAQEAASILRLQEVLRNMPAEAERFLAQRAEEEEDADEEGKSSLGLRQIPLESEIEITLKTGNKYAGRVETAMENGEGFALRAVRGVSETRRPSPREFAYDEVQSYTIKKLKGWAPPEVVAGVPSRQRIHVVLLNGKEIKGRLTKVTNGGFWLEDNPTMFDFDEVEKLKYGRGPALKITLIALGAFAAFAVIGYIAMDFGSGFKGGLL